MMTDTITTPITTNIATTTTTGINLNDCVITTHTTPIQDCSFNLNDYFNIFQQKDILNKSLETSIKSLSKKLSKPSYYIKKIEEIVPFKVYKFIFEDEAFEKTVKLDSDSFNLVYAASLAIAKKLYKKDFTFEGVLYQANLLQYNKKINKMINKAIKQFLTEKEEKAKQELVEKEAKQRKEAKALKKHLKRQEKRDAESKQIEQDLINVIAKAIKMSNEDK